MTMEEKMDRILEDLVVLKSDIREIKAVLAGQGNRMDRKFRNVTSRLFVMAEKLVSSKNKSEKQ